MFSWLFQSPSTASFANRAPASLAIVLLSEEDQFDTSYLEQGQSGGRSAARKLHKVIEGEVGEGVSVLFYYVSCVRPPDETADETAFFDGFCSSTSKMTLTVPPGAGAGGSVKRVAQLVSFFLPLPFVTKLFLGYTSSDTLIDNLESLSVEQRGKITVLDAKLVKHNRLVEEGGFKVLKVEAGLFGQKKEEMSPPPRTGLSATRNEGFARIEPGRVNEHDSHRPRQKFVPTADFPPPAPLPPGPFEVPRLFFNEKKPCRDFYLDKDGCGNGSRCQYSHDYPFTTEEWLAFPLSVGSILGSNRTVYGPSSSEYGYGRKAIRSARARIGTLTGWRPGSAPFPACLSRIAGGTDLVRRDITPPVLSSHPGQAHCVSICDSFSLPWSETEEAAPPEDENDFDSGDAAVVLKKLGPSLAAWQKERSAPLGRRLADLSLEDQLIGRIVFATASRLWSANSPPSTSTFPSQSQPENRPLLARQLLVNAQTRADIAAVWRHPSPNNAVSLLLLYQLINRGEISSEEAKPYLAALVGHLRALNRTNPELLLGASGSNTSALVWCLMAFDAFAAVERSEEPIVSDREYERLLRPLPIDLPSIAAVRFALSSDPWSLTNYLLVPLGAAIDVGRRLARCLDGLESRGGGMTVERQMELGEVWERTGEICSWGAEVLEAGEKMDGLDIFTATVLHMYVSLAYGAAVFSQLAIVLFLEKRPPQEKTGFLAQLQNGFPGTVARYLRSIRVTAGGNNFLTVFTGTAWSVSRLVTFSHHFMKTSAWNPLLHPGGMTDKLSSLNFLHDTLASVERSYPGEDLAKAVKAVEAEQASIQVILGTSASEALPTPAFVRAATATPSNVVASLLASPDPLTGSSRATPNTLPRPSTDSSSHPSVALKPSLIRISTWTHILDKAERPAAEYYGYSRRDGTGEKQPRPKRSPEATSTGSSSGSGASGIMRDSGDSPPGAPPGVTWADLGFDYRPATSAGGNSPPAMGDAPSILQPERGACSNPPLHALALFGDVANSFGDGAGAYLTELGLSPFPEYQPPPSAATTSNPHYPSSTPSYSTASTPFPFQSQPPPPQPVPVVNYTSIPPGTAVYPYPPSSASQPPQPSFPSTHDLPTYPSSALPVSPLPPTSGPYPNVPVAFPSMGSHPPANPPSTPLPFYTSAGLTAGMTASAGPPDQAVAAAVGGEGGGEADSDYLTSFLATLVNEAGPSPPRPVAFSGGFGGAWEGMDGEVGGLNGMDGLEGLGGEKREQEHGGMGEFGQAQLFFS